LTSSSNVCFAARMALWRAKQTLEDDVKKYREMSLEEAQAVFSRLNVPETEIPKAITALQKVGIQARLNLEQMPSSKLLL